MVNVGNYSSHMEQYEGHCIWPGEVALHLRFYPSTIQVPFTILGPCHQLNVGAHNSTKKKNRGEKKNNQLVVSTQLKHISQIVSSPR